MTEENKNQLQKSNTEKSIRLIDPETATQDTEYLNEVFDSIAHRFPKEFELAQGRSFFQMEKFMACNQYTPSSQYKHILKNSAIMRKELFRVIKEGIENEREFDANWNSEEGTKARENNQPIEVLDGEGNPRKRWYDLEKLQYKIDQQELACSIKDKVSQLAFFDALLDAIEERNGGPITKEQFDREEPDYWTSRMSKQLHDHRVAHMTGLKYGDVESARNAAAHPVIPGSINQSKDIPTIESLVNDPDRMLLEAQVNIAEGENRTSTSNHSVEELYKVVDKHMQKRELEAQQMIESMGGQELSKTMEEYSSNNQSTVQNHPSEEIDLSSLGISTRDT